MFSYWNMEFFTGLSLDAGCNAIYTFVNKPTKLAKIIPCMVGDGGFSAPASEKLFFDYVICSYRVPRWYFMIGTLVL